MLHWVSLKVRSLLEKKILLSHSRPSKAISWLQNGLGLTASTCTNKIVSFKGPLENVHIRQAIPPIHFSWHEDFSWNSIYLVMQDRKVKWCCGIHERHSSTANGTLASYSSAALVKQSASFSQFTMFLLKELMYLKAMSCVLRSRNFRKFPTDVFSKWPTFPQVFIKGSLIGGCDILMEMNQSGELRNFLLSEKVIQE